MRHLARDLKILTVVALLATGPVGNARDPEEGDDRVTPNSASPDGKWVCRRPEIDEAAAQNGVSSDCAIVRAGTTKPVVELPLYVGAGVDSDKVCKVLWAPDSKRFAYNYRAGGRYESTNVYQLRDGKWSELRSLEADETSQPLKRVQTAQLRKHKLPEDTYRRRIWDTWEVTRWADAHTAILYVYSIKTVTLKEGDDEMADLAAHFLFTIRFDDRGKWRVIKAHQMSAKEVKARDAASERDNKVEE
jgi:hypothetical protein